MTSIYPDRPVLAVLCAVCRDGRILLVQRANEPDRGKWGFPGGRVELGETLFAAARRELREETGIEAEPVEVLTAVDVIDRDAEGKVRFHYVLVTVLAEWRNGEGAAADDALAVAWLAPEEIVDRPRSYDVERVARLALACQGARPGGR